METFLKDKVAIITGGGTGIGKGIALALARAGAYVVVCGRRQERLEQTLAAIQEFGGKALVVKADITVPSEVAQMVEQTLAHFGRIDILINNAGTGDGGPFYGTSLETWDRVMETNLRGPFLAIREVLPHMRKQRSGDIINISSEAGLEYYANNSLYGLSKHALNDLGEYVQHENQDMNIRVNTICPGMVDTEMAEVHSNLDRSKCLIPEDIADLVVFLLTRRSNVKFGLPILIQTMENPWL